MNNPTLTEFCFGMIGRADIEGSKSDVAMNAWPPQASSCIPTGLFKPALVPSPTQAFMRTSTVSGGSSPYLKPVAYLPTNTLASVEPPSPCTKYSEYGQVKLRIVPI